MAPPISKLIDPTVPNTTSTTSTGTSTTIPSSSSSTDQVNSAHITRKSFKSTTRDRPKHSEKLAGDRHHGQPKKSGAGKYNWGNPSEVLNEKDIIVHPSQKGDVNYESDDGTDDTWRYSTEHAKREYDKLRPSLPRRFSLNQQEFVTNVTNYNEFKNLMKKTLSEYLVHHLYAEFKSALESIHTNTVYYQELPYIIMKYSIDKSTEQRSKLDSLLHLLVKDEYITSQQLYAGIEKLFDHIDDLTLDVPTAKNVVWETVHYLVGYGLITKEQETTLHEDDELLSDKHTVDNIKENYENLIADYFDNPVIETVKEELVDMHTVYFAHQSAPYATALEFEFVKRLINHALDRRNIDRHNALNLLSALCPDVISREQLGKAYSVLLERIEDLALDIPNVLTLLAVFIARAVIDDILPPSFLLRVDAAEGDGASRCVKAAQQLLQQPDAVEKLNVIFLNAPEERRPSVASIVESPAMRAQIEATGDINGVPHQPIERSASTPMSEHEINAHQQAAQRVNGTDAVAQRVA